MIDQTNSFILLILLATAACWDYRSHRIPNALSVVILISGLILQIAQHGLTGAIQAGLGLLVGFVVSIIPYQRGGMAAGDVKLMAAIGTFLGPVLVLIAAGTATIIGASMGMSLLALQHYRGSSPSIDRLLLTKFPFAGAIAIGSACALLFRGTL